MQARNHAFHTLLAVLLCVMASAATAQTSEVEYRATGRGATLEEAIENALFEVARQANGTHVQASQASSVKTVSGSLSGPEGDTGFRYEERSDSRVRTSASGLVSGYELLSQHRSGRGMTVEILATVPRYRVPGIDTSNRRRLALIPFGSRLGHVDFFGLSDGRLLADDLSQALLGQFVQSRRFTVLDRESWGAIQQEKALLSSGDVPIAEKAKLGRSLGADYLVLGELLEADGGHFASTQRLTGIQQHETAARIAVSFRIVVPATGEIRFADTLELDVSDRRGDAVASRTAAINALARRLAGLTLDRIYPMQVISVASPDQVVLNQGGSTLAVGDRLLLVEQGRTMVDPYTKESLGALETPVGQLEVTRVDGKMAYATVVGAASAVVKPGQLARRELPGDGTHQTTPVSPPTPRTEGVRLPFDR